MTDTRRNIPLPVNTWVNLYAESFIPVGIQLQVENTGTCDVNLVVQASQPNQDHKAFNVLKRDGDQLQNNAGDTGAWAYCANTAGLVNVSIKDASGFHPDTGSPTVDQGNSELEFRSALLASLGSIDTELHLLNARFEEAFNTGLDGGDV